MTLASELAQATRRLLEAGVPDAALDAEWLLADALGIDRATLFVRREEALDAEIAKRFGKALERRVKREPLQHVLGEQEFYGRSFRCDRRALIPRQETETLIDAALALPEHLGAPLERGPRVCDAGTGTGCIAITLAAERPDWAVDAVDASADALALAEANVEVHGVGNQVTLQKLRFDELLRRAGAYDLLVSNPPYIAESEWEALQPEVRDFDPREALVSGQTGLEAYGELARVAWVALNPGGYLVLEVGFGQARLVERILGDRGFRETATRNDLAGVERVVIGQRPGRG